MGCPPPGPGAYVGAAVMVLTQIVMAAIMTMTPGAHARVPPRLGGVGLVISVHIGAMCLLGAVQVMLFCANSWLSEANGSGSCRG